MQFNPTGKVGFCIGADFERPSQEILEQLKGFGTPALSDGLNRFNTMSYDIKPIHSQAVVAGPALTVRLRPGDNLMLHKAIALAKEGDIIVVDTCGCMSCCVMGGLMAAAAFKKKIGGFVIDGAIRDITELKEHKYPIFAKGVVSSVGDKDGPGEINMPISCGGVPVLPGDIVVGDENGIVVIQPWSLEQVIKNTQTKLAYEEKRAIEISQGIIAKADIDQLLVSKGIIPSN